MAGRNNFQLYFDQNQKPILGQKQLFLLIEISAPEQSLISLLFQRMTKVLCLIYTRTHCSLKQALIFKFVLPNDCEVQRFATRYGNIVQMRFNFLKGTYSLDGRKLAVSITRNAWKHKAIISKLFKRVIGNRLNLNHLECNTRSWLPSFNYSEGFQGWLKRFKRKVQHFDIKKHSMFKLFTPYQIWTHLRFVRFPSGNKWSKKQWYRRKP